MQFLLVLGLISLFWLLVEIVMRQISYRTGFHSSLLRARIAQQQKHFGMKAASGYEWVPVPEKDQWYITTAGWPWVSTLTSGEVAVALLEWDIAEGS